MGDVATYSDGVVPSTYHNKATVSIYKQHTVNFITTENNKSSTNNDRQPMFISQVFKPIQPIFVDYFTDFP